MSRPMIGITCYIEHARFTVWDAEAALLPYRYLEMVDRAGGQPVLLPPIGDPSIAVSRLDGIILAGGGDIDPARYSSVPHQKTDYVRDFRDNAEFAVVSEALEKNTPFLGICRGLQVLNVTLGGSLHQHLPDILGHEKHSPGPGNYGQLPVEIVPGTYIAKILGEESVTVPHYHHQ